MCINSGFKTLRLGHDVVYSRSAVGGVGQLDKALKHA
jgi:hypothetical protein